MALYEVTVTQGLAFHIHANSEEDAKKQLPFYKPAYVETTGIDVIELREEAN